MSEQSLAITSTLSAQSTLEMGLKARLFNHGMRRRRVALGLTQKQLGEAVGIGLQTIWSIECLRRQPSSALRDRLAKFLECDAQVIWPDWMTELRSSTVESVAHVGQADFAVLTHKMEKQLKQRIETNPFRSEEARVALTKAIATLSFREREIIKMRYGLGDGARPCTQEEVARVFGVSKPRIGQLEANAIRKLQRPQCINSIVLAIDDAISA